MSIINIARHTVALVLLLAFFLIIKGEIVAGSILIFIEDQGIDTGIIGEIFIKVAGNLQKMYKQILQLL